MVKTICTQGTSGRTSETILSAHRRARSYPQLGQAPLDFQENGTSLRIVVVRRDPTRVVPTVFRR